MKQYQNNFMVGAHRNMKNRMKCRSFRKRTTSVAPPEGSEVPIKEEKETPSPRELQGPCFRYKHNLTICSMEGSTESRGDPVLASQQARATVRSRQGAVRRSTDSGCLSALAPGRPEFLFCFLSLEIQNRFFFLHLQVT